MSLAYSGDICWTVPMPRVATCHAAIKATNSAMEMTVARPASETVGEGPGQNLLDHGDGLVDIVGRRDRLGDLLAILGLGGEGGGVDDRLQQRGVGIWRPRDELLRCGKDATGMTLPQFLRQHVD